MKPFDKLLFPLIGLAFWVGGTILYEFRGQYVFEGSKALLDQLHPHADGHSGGLRFNFAVAPYAAS